MAKIPSPDEFASSAGKGGKPRTCAVCALDPKLRAVIDDAIMKQNRSPEFVKHHLRDHYGLCGDISDGAFRGHAIRHLGYARKK